MANMGYCRFENTVRDLRDCYEHMEDELSEREAKARRRMIRLAREIVDDFGYLADADNG
jgi:hypothetical protein